jgi:hypothetical protein
VVCALENVLHVTVQTRGTVTVLLREQQREGKNVTRHGDKWKGKDLKKIWKERKKQTNKQKKEEIRKIKAKLGIKTYWRLLMPSETCRHNFDCQNYREYVYNCRKYEENNREVIENYRENRENNREVTENYREDTESNMEVT